MQISLDWPEIQQFHHFIQSSKGSYLDLQFIFLLTANSAQDIQKTIIFVNIVLNIWPMIEIIQKWIKVLDYLEGSD